MSRYRQVIDFQNTQIRTKLPSSRLKKYLLFAGKEAFKKETDSLLGSGKYLCNDSIALYTHQAKPQGWGTQKQQSLGEPRVE